MAQPKVAVDGKSAPPAGGIVGQREAVLPFQGQNDAVSDRRSGSSAPRASGSGQHSSPGQLTEKAARLVQAGLPWPGEEEIEHEVRKMVVESGVPWSLNTAVEEKYELVAPLGTGGFAKVFKGKCKADNEDVAVKHIAILEDGDREIVYKEIKHLTMLKDVKQVVEILEVIEHGNDMYIAMELCKGGELHASFEDTQAGAFTYGDVGRIAVTMLMLADAMHSRGLVHCDLKPENFCLVRPLADGVPLTDNLRLIDFGLSQRVRGGQAIAGLAGSIPYMAPEIKTRMYDHKVDIWSIGVIVYTLLNGALPFDGRSAEEIMSRAATRQPDVSQLHPAVGDFVKWLLTKDPRKRPDAREALGHPWLKVTSSKSEQGDAYMQAISNEVAQNLSVFAASNKLQRAFMHLAVGFLHKNEMEKMLAMFNTLNTDRTTPLPAAEIKEMLCRGRRHEDQDAILKTVDMVMGPDGDLSINDFIVASMNQYRNLSDAVIKTMFRALDKDDDGWITAEDAFEALQPTGVHISVRELTKLFDKYGVKRRLGDAHAQTGLMTYHEFHELMMPSVSQRYTHELDGIVSAFRNNNNNNNPFNKLARRIVAENAPATKEIERIKNAFLAMDKDGSGTLTLEELSKGVRTAGYVVSDQDLKRLFKELDTDGTGLVRYHEFVAGAIDTNILVGDSLLRWVFEFMDDDDSNTITGANLKTILDHMDWTDAEKEKIWVAACGGEACMATCNLTFDQFKALIEGEGGFDLHSRVKESAVALAAHAPQTAQARPLPQGMYFEGGSPEATRQASEEGGTTAHPSAASALPPQQSATFDVAEGESEGESDDDAAKPALLTKRNGTLSPEMSKEMSRHLEETLRLRPATHLYNGGEPTVPTMLPQRSGRTSDGAEGSSPPSLVQFKSCPASNTGAETAASAKPEQATAVQVAPHKTSASAPIQAANGTPGWAQPSSILKPSGTAKLKAKMKRMFTGKKK